MTTSAINSNTPTAGNTSNSSTPATLPGQDLANEQTFLQLFVAQLKNQDPLNPNSQDPTQMVSELAQFSELEQSLQLNSTVSNIDSLLVANQNASAGTTATNSTTNTNGVQGS
jgi:flagellar basal-body rod modification protein FlgD